MVMVRIAWKGVVVKTFLIDFVQSHAILMGDDPCRVKDRSLFLRRFQRREKLAKAILGLGRNRIEPPKARDSGSLPFTQAKLVIG